MTSPKVVLIVACALAAVVVGAVAATTFLAAIDKEAPALIGDLAKVAIGALGSLLASTRGELPAPVNIVNEQADPVPVEAVPAAKPARARGAAKKAAGPARR